MGGEGGLDHKRPPRTDVFLAGHLSWLKHSYYLKLFTRHRFVRKTLPTLPHKVSHWQRCLLLSLMLPLPTQSLMNLNCSQVSLKSVEPLQTRRSCQATGTAQSSLGNKGSIEIRICCSLSDRITVIFSRRNCSAHNYASC